MGTADEGKLLPESSWRLNASFGEGHPTNVIAICRWRAEAGMVWHRCHRLRITKKYGCSFVFRVFSHRKTLLNLPRWAFERSNAPHDGRRAPVWASGNLTEVVKSKAGVLIAHLKAQKSVAMETKTVALSFSYTSFRAVSRFTFLVAINGIVSWVNSRLIVN